MKRSFALTFFAYLIPTFILGFCWHMIWFHDLYAQLNIYKPNPIIPFGLGSMIIQGAVFAWAYPRLFADAREHWAKKSIRAAVVFGILSWSFTTLAVAAKHPMASIRTFVEIETAFTAIQFAIVAPLMTLVSRFNN